MRLAFLLFLLLTPHALAQEITLWTWALKPAYNDYIQNIARDFEAQNPGVTVIWVDVPGDAIERKLFAAAAAGRMPDVINLPDKAFVRFAQLGAMRDLTGLLPGDPHQQFVPGALAGATFDHKLMGLPWYLSNEIAVINKPLLESGGLTVDTVGKDFATLRSQAVAFHKKTGKFLFMMRLGEIDLLAQIIAEDLKPIVPASAGGYESNLTRDPRIAKLMSEWVGLFRQGALPRESATGAYPDMVAAFKEGRVALVNANMVRVIKKDTPQLFEQLAIAPPIVGARDTPSLSSVMLGVSSTSKHPQLAAKLAWHVLLPAYQEELAVRASRLPSTIASQSVMASGATGDDALARATRVSIDALPRSTSFVQPTGTWPDLEKVFSEGMKRALLGGSDIDAALLDIETQWNVILRADAAGLPYK